MLDKSVSLVVPVYNEEEIIGQSIEVFLRSLSCICRDYEVIIVDDGSQDGTSRILDRFSSKNEHIKVLTNDTNRGSGVSLWRGFRAATKEFVVSNFADRPFNIANLEKVLASTDFNTIDFVIIVREDRSANTFYRKITSYLNYWLIRLLFQVHISDFQFVQVYKRRILEGIHIHSQETFVPPELMFKLMKRGYQYVELTCPFEKRMGGRSKCGHPKKVIKSVCEIFKFWIRWNILRKKD